MARSFFNALLWFHGIFRFQWTLDDELVVAHRWESKESRYLRFLPQLRLARSRSRCSLLPPQHMPWTLKGGSKCDLFDYACAAKERAAKAAME